MHEIIKTGQDCNIPKQIFEEKKRINKFLLKLHHICTSVELRIPIHVCVLNPSNCETLKIQIFNLQQNSNIIYLHQVVTKV